MLKSGVYSMRFNCDGYVGFGRLCLDGQLGRGGDDCYRVEGQISESGRHLIGALTIDLAPGVSGNSRIKGLFACAMTGTRDEDSFILYGLGPLGLIVEIACQWAGTVDGRVADRRAFDQSGDRRARGRHPG